MWSGNGPLDWQVLDRLLGAPCLKAPTLGICCSQGQDPSQGPFWEVAEYVMYCDDLALGWEAGLCLPMYGRSPEGLYTSILDGLLPLSYPVRVYRLTCVFSASRNLWERPKQAGWEFRV